MTKRKQALPFKRRSSYQAYPEDLHMETQPGKKHYDPRAFHEPVERDVRWILKHGVQKALLVEKEGDRVTVIDGRQRYINTCEANRRLEAEGQPRIMVPVAPKRGDPVKLFEIRVICNAHRKQDDPVTEAHLIQQYLDMGHTDEDASDLWGYTTRTILNRLYLLELCQEVQQAVVTGKINVSRAIKLRNLSFAEQRRALKEKPAPRKTRRPSLKRVRLVTQSKKAKLRDDVLAAIRWAAGEITADEAGQKIKGFKEALEEAEAPA